MLALPTRPPTLPLRVLRTGAEKAQVGVEHVLDPEEHVAEAGGAHLAGEIVASGEHRRRHALDDEVDVVQAGIRDPPAQRAEALAR